MKYVRRKRSYTRRRRIARRSRTTASRYGRRQQRAGNSSFTKKYTRVFTLEAPPGSYEGRATVSLIGGVNSTVPLNTITLKGCDQDSNLSTDMRLFQFFKIKGVALKLFFPPPTDANATPVQWALAYSASNVLAPDLPPERMQTMAAYQTGPCVPDKAISRYYNVARTCRRFGLQYCDTTEYGNWDTVNQQLYNNQLHANEGSSVAVRIYRGTSEASSSRRIATLQVTYYVTYKGTKGGSSLVSAAG